MPGSSASLEGKPGVPALNSGSEGWRIFPLADGPG